MFLNFKTQVFSFHWIRFFAFWKINLMSIFYKFRMIYREMWNIFSFFSLISMYMSCGSFHKCVNHRAVSKNAGFRDTIEEIHEQYHSWEMEIIFSYFSESCVYKRIHLAPCEYSNCLWNNLKYWRSSPMGIHFSSNYLKEMDWRIHFQGNDTTIKNANKKNQLK